MLKTGQQLDVSTGKLAFRPVVRAKNYVPSKACSPAKRLSQSLSDFCEWGEKSM